jgi:hypothetical protein
MPRALPATLESAMDDGIFKAYVAIGRRNYLAGQLTSYTTLTTRILYYKYDGLNLTVKYASSNLPATDGLILGERYFIERGITASGSNYTIRSASLRFDDYTIEKQIITAKFSIFSDDEKPPTRDGYVSYETILTNVNPNYAKDGTLDFVTGDHWDYKFFPTGRSLSLPSYANLLPLLRQKYLIEAVDNSDDDNEDEIQYYHLAGETFEWHAGETDKGGVSVCYSPTLNIFCAVAGATPSDDVYISSDGINWTKYDSGHNAKWNKVRWFEERQLFIAVGEDVAPSTKNMMTSTDGITWTNVLDFTGNPIKDVCYSPLLDLFVVVCSAPGGTENIHTSTDTTTWTARTHDANDFSSVCWSPDLSLFVAVGYLGSNSIQTSSNGINWTTRSSVGGWLSVIYTTELRLYIAVGDGTDANYVYTSPDGVNWTSRTPALNRNWNAVAYSKALHLLMAVSDSGVDDAWAMTSTDGITWTSQAVPYDVDYFDVCAADELRMFVAVAGPSTLRNIYWNPTALTPDHTITQGDITLFSDSSSRRFLWRDEADTIHTYGFGEYHNLGYLESTDSPPDNYLNAPRARATVGIHLKYKSGDIFKLQISASQYATYYARVTETLDPNADIGWRSEIELLERFSNTNAGAMPSTIERVAPYTPLNTTDFDGNLDETVNNLQALAERVDDLTLVPDTESTQDIIGAMLAGNTETGITVTYQDSDGTIDFELITEYIEDLVGNMVSGAGIGSVIVIYNDTTGQLEFSLANESVQDIVGNMLTGNTENNIEVTYQDSDGTIDFNTIFLFPLATYTDLNPINASNKFPYAGTIEASMSLVKWSVSIFTATSHTGSAYFTLDLKLRQSVPGSDVTLATIDTKTIVGGQQTTLSTTTFSQAITGTGYLYIQCTKTSTPTDIYITCPALRAKLT